MTALGETSVRVFKAAWFTKAARKAHITDDELCSAISQIVRGQADDLGGGVYKKRLRKNQYRSIILAKIEDDELAEFRKLAKAYGALTPKQMNRLLQNQDWTEICNGNKA